MTEIKGLDFIEYLQCVHLKHFLISAIGGETIVEPLKQQDRLIVFIFCSLNNAIVLLSSCFVVSKQVATKRPGWNSHLRRGGAARCVPTWYLLGCSPSKRLQ